MRALLSQARVGGDGGGEGSQTGERGKRTVLRMAPLLTGEEYDSEEMADFGFVNEVMANDGFAERAVEYAEKIAAGPPIAMAAAKRAMHFGVLDEEAGLEVEAGAFGRLTQTDDLNEGISAFLEDREPAFEGG